MTGVGSSIISCDREKDSDTRSSTIEHGEGDADGDEQSGELLRLGARIRIIGVSKDE